MSAGDEKRQTEQGHWSKINILVDSLEAADITGQSSLGSGIYRIHWVKGFIAPLKFDTSPCPISRMFTNDLEGVLYIGSSTDIGDRVRSFARGDHTGSQKLRLACSWKNTDLPQLGFSYILLNTLNLQTAEDFVLRKYLTQFGELPPCNGELPLGFKSAWRDRDTPKNNISMSRNTKQQKNFDHTKMLIHQRSQSGGVPVTFQRKISCSATNQSVKSSSSNEPFAR